jgi:putative phosphoribosyl transferase
MGCAMDFRFQDRSQAGQLLAARLSEYDGRADVVVLALARGGVPVGYEIALALHAPLDVFIVRKLGVPFQPELAMGAIASGGIEVLNEDLIDQLDISSADLQRVVAHEQAELQRREVAYRSGRPPLNVRGKTVIVVDDGLATGASMRAAVLALRRRGPGQIIVAVPVGAPSSVDALRHIADEVVCLRMPVPFDAIGAWYEDFSQTSDAEVCHTLEIAARGTGASAVAGERGGL